MNPDIEMVDVAPGLSPGPSPGDREMVDVAPGPSPGDREVLMTPGDREVLMTPEDALLVTSDQDMTSGIVTLRDECELVPVGQETEKQIQDILEENDKTGFEVDLQSYLNTDTADQAAIHATVFKNKYNNKTYHKEGFLVVELFPKKDWVGYHLVVDGHRMRMNTRRCEATVYRCKHQEYGCNVRFRIRVNEMTKVNMHEHWPVQKKFVDDINYHYTCVYCGQQFRDLARRKHHMLTEPHLNAPWPLEEDLCIFAEAAPAGDLSGVSEDAIEIPEGLPKLLSNIANIDDRLFVDGDCNVVVLRPGEDRIPVYPKSKPYPPNAIRPLPGFGVAFTAKGVAFTKVKDKVVKIKNSARPKNSAASRIVKNVVQEAPTPSPNASMIKKKKKRDEESSTVDVRIENVIEEYENKVVLHCDLCDVKLSSLKHRATHNMSAEHQQNKERLLDETAKCRASLTFNKPVFTEDFLVYNKALEAELRGLRKGAVELEEQNAVLSSHVTELTNVVRELRNAKAVMQQKNTNLDLHLNSLKSELSKVFASVLSTEVSADNFNETFNKLSVAVIGKGANKRGTDGIITDKLKKQLKQARIDPVSL